MFEIWELKLFKPVWTFQNQTTGLYKQSFLFAEVRCAGRKKIIVENIYVSASLQKLPVAF